MARTYEEMMARMDELEKAQAAATAAPVPAPPAARVPAAPKPAVAPGMEALPKPSAAPPAPKVTRRASRVTPKVEEIKAPKPPEVEAPKPVVLTPDLAKPIDYKKFYDRSDSTFDSALYRTAAAMNVPQDKLSGIAQAQGVDLEAIFKARQKGRTYDEIAKAGRERGVIGFMPVEEREKAFNKLAQDVEKAQRGDAGDTVELVRSGADKGFGPARALGGYTIAGTQEELPEVAKPGEHGYAIAQILVEALQKDPSAVRAYDLYGRSLATGNTQRYIDDRVEDLRKRANIKASDADAMEKMAALRKRAINEVIAYKTVGQWTPVVTLGDVEVREGRASPGALAALKPNIEIIGFNNKRQAIFRQESPMGVLFRVIDIPQAAIAGVLSGQTVGQGIQSGANLLEYSLDATKDSAMYVKAPVVAAGFAASILFPDALVAAGAAGKAVKAVSKIRAARKIAPEATALLETIVRTRKAGDYEAAAAAEKQLRSLLPDVASNLDSADAAVARFQKLAEPESDILDTDLAALIAGAAPEQARVVAGRPFLHPSLRKFVVGPSGLEQADYAELFDTRRQLDRVQRAKAEYIKARTTGRSITDYTKDYIRGRVHDVFENLPPERQLSLTQVNRMADLISAQAPAALLDQKQFKKAVEDALKADAEFGTDAYKMARQDAYKAIGGRTETKLDEIRGKTIEELEAADMGLFDRAIKAIEQNNTARGVAAQLLRDEIAGAARLRVEPLELFDEVAPKLSSGEPIRLTPGGLLLLHHLRQAYPKQDFKEAYATITIIDKMIEGAAQAREVSPLALYQEIFPLIKRGTPEDLKRLAGDLKAGKVPTGGAPTGGAPAAPAAPTKAARARAEAKLREMMRRLGDEELDEIEGMLRADGVQEGEAYALDAIKREKQRRAREAKKAAAATPAAPSVEEQLADVSDEELANAIKALEEGPPGPMLDDLRAEQARRAAEAPTPVVVEEVVEAPVAAPTVEAPPAAVTAPAGLVSAQRTDFKSVDEFKQAVIDAGGAGFVTKQGSVYQQVGPLTQRFKTPHIEHDPKDVGLKKPSKRTIYLKAKLEGGGPDRLRETGVGVSNASTRWLIDDTTNRAYLVSRVKDGPVKEYRFDVLRKDADGKTIPFVEFDTQPFMGAVVLELFDDAAPVPTMVGKDKVADLPGHKSFHPGNQITEMFGSEAAAPPTPAPIAAAAEVQPEAAKIVEAPVRAPAPAALKSPDVTWAAYFRKTIKPEKPSDALRAVAQRVLAATDDPDYARSYATREATARLTGKTPEQILDAPPTEREALLQRLDVDGGVTEDDLVMHAAPSMFVDVTQKEALELGGFPKGTKPEDITPEVLDSLIDRVAEIAAQVGGGSALEPRLREMGGGSVESLADVRYNAKELQDRIVPIEKDVAFTFVRKMHSKLPDPRPQGLLASVGVAAGGDVRVVGLLNTPSAPFADAAGVVELSRVASDGKLKNGSSAITYWAMQNLQRFNRSGDPAKARLVTTSLLTEPGEVYKALEPEGLHPTSLVTPSEGTGSRAGAKGTAQKGEWKINWEFGPAAAPEAPHLYHLQPVYRDVVMDGKPLTAARLNSLVQRPGTDLVDAYKDAARVLGVSLKDEPVMVAARQAFRATPEGRQAIADDIRHMLLEKFNSKAVADADLATRRLPEKTQTALSGAMTSMKDASNLEWLRAVAKLAKVKKSDLAPAAPSLTRVLRAVDAGQVSPDVLQTASKEQVIDLVRRTHRAGEDFGKAVDEWLKIISEVPAPVKRKRATRVKAEAAAPEAAPAVKPPDVFPSIQRDAARAGIVRQDKARQAEIMLGEIYGRSVAYEWEEVPEQFRVNAGRRLNEALEGLRAKKITQEQFNELVSNVGLELDAQKTLRRARVETAEPKRGPDVVRARLLAAKAEGTISPEGADLAEWFIRQNPNIAEDLAITIGGPAYVGKRIGSPIGRAVQGAYEPIQDIVGLIVGRADELTATHEVLHRTERMLPEALQEAIRKERTKQLTKAIKTATDKDRPFLLAFLAPSNENLKLRKEAFEFGNLDPAKYYQFANTSEFWAVNASRIVSGRYAAFNKGVVARAKQWLTEFVQKVKSIFRLPSDAPLIRGLDAVLKGDGTFVSEEMLSQGDIYRSIEARAGALRGYIEPEQRPVAATLFSGGGLVEAGLQNVVRPGYAVEARGDIAAHYGKVFGEHVENVDVRSVDFNKLKDKDIGFLHASPVCKNFSAAKAVNAAGEQALDIETATATARAIDELKPPVFTLENVADYLDSDALRRIEDALTRNGYTFDKNVYNAADYGGATTRKRLIIRAVREGELPPLPTKTGSADWYERVSDLVDDLPSSDMPPFMQRRLEAAGIDWRNLDRPLMVAGGSAWADELPYAFAGGPTFTIKATPKELHRIILPGGDVREATPRVLARITGLSDDYPLPATKAAAVTIIGNGIPLELTDAVIAPVIESRAAQVRRVFPSIEAEAPMPSGIPADALRQVSPTGEVKGAVEWLEDGSSVVYLFEGADASTVLHEVAHVVRRNILSNEDMGFIASWVQGLGVNVGHQYGEFTGDAVEIEKAEELFAKAFEQYVAEGKAPAGLEGAFAQLKDAVANVYKAVKDPVIGVELQPEVRRVFDGLFATEPKQADQSLKEAIRRGILGGPEAEVDILTVLSREAKRKGLDQFSPNELATRINEAKANIKQIAKRDPTGTDVVLKFETKVLGKDKWTINDLAAAQAARDARLAPQAEARMALLRDMTGKGRGKAAIYKQDTAVESLWTALSSKETDAPMTKQAKKALRGVASLYFGGNVLEETKMAGQPPAFRRALDTSARIVEQSLADTVALVNDAVATGDDTQLLRYLTGDSDVAKVSGRPILSSGHDKMGAVNRMIQRAIAAFKDDEKEALIELADAINTKDPVERGQKLVTLGFTASGGEVSFKEADEARKAMSDALRRAVGKLLYPEKKDADIGTALAAAIRDSVNAPDKARPSHELRLVETLTYIGGVTARDGDLFKGDSKDVVRTLLGDIRKIYGEIGEESARRVAVQIGAFGGADQAKQFLVRMDLGVDEKTQAAFARFLNGEQPGAENIAGVKRMFDTFGRDIQFVPDAALDVDFYIPRAARERMAQVLSRAQFRTEESVGAADALATSYRYMKTRMTRGNFFIRQRYFMMNTVDHFNAMAYTEGFGVAAASTARVIAQDLVIIPGVREILEVGKAAGVLSPVATERLRSSLQNLGDRAAGRIGKMMSVSKYRIEVNPILEGVDGGFTVGGKVYRYRDIRDIAVEEGVFSSFDTRELQRAILREGQLVLGDAAAQKAVVRSPTRLAWMRNGLASLEESVSDIAEAWGERERLGAMVTLMEAGYDPRAAAQITVKALFDYSQSMTKLDRLWLVNLLLPFWAFQKNANQQVFNMLFSPWGGYRMMVVKRARERTSDLLGNIMYNTLVDDYGVDVESMPPELQDSYYATIKAFEEAFGPDGPPPEAKRAMRMLLSGRAIDVEDGVLMETSAEIQRLRSAGAFADLARFIPFTVAEPSKAGRSSIMRDRAGFPVPFPRSEGVRTYNALLGDNHSYMELYWPDSTIEAGMKWHTQVAATMFLLAAEGAAETGLTGLREGGIDEVTVQRVLQPIIDVERSPLIAPFLEQPPPKRIAAAATPEAWMKVHPMLGKMLDDVYGTTFLRVPAVADPLLVDEDGNLPQLTPDQITEIKRLQEQYPDIGVLKNQRYYLPGGVWATAFENSPLGELNSLLIRLEDEPLESQGRQSIQGEILIWARKYAGVDVTLTAPSQAVKREEPKKKTTTAGTQTF